MLKDWETFYFMLGSSAAALIGLLFVVVTLTAEIDTARAEAGQRTYLNPTIFHFVTIVITSAVAVMPDPPVTVVSIAIAVPAIAGFYFAAMALRRMMRGDPTVPHWSDYIFYGGLPALAYLCLIASAAGFWAGAAFAVDGIAVGVLALLLIGIADAWDLATYLSNHRRG